MRMEEKNEAVTVLERQQLTFNDCTHSLELG